MAVVVAVMNQKGGVGKTTVAQHLAVVWKAQGLSVLLVDADEQETLFEWAEQRRENTNMPLVRYGDILARRYGICREWREETLSEQTPETVRCATGVELLDLIRVERPSRDVIVIDCPPRLGEEQQSSLLVSDVVLVPVTPGQKNVGSTVHATRTMALWSQRLREHGVESLPSVMYLLNKVRKRTAVPLRRSVRQMAAALNGIGVHSTLAAVELCDRPDDVEECSGDGSLIIDESKLSDLTSQFFQLATEVLEHGQDKIQGLSTPGAGQTRSAHDAA